MDECKIPARSISMLVQIKQALLADNELAHKVTGCGKFVATHYIDDLIANACKLESLCHDYRANYNLEHERVKEFHKLLGGFEPDILSDEEKAEVAALVEKWRQKDEEV